MSMNKKNYYLLACIWLLFLLITNLFSCQNKKKSMAKNDVWQDPHSYSNHQEVRVRHLDLNLEIDFERTILSGEVMLHLDYLKSTDSLVLDGSDLKIQYVTDDNNKPLAFVVSSPSAVKGQRIAIGLSGKETKWVKVKYQTSPDAEALQWIPAAQTAGKKHPYMFSQSQAILARSWVPIQDCPIVRFTYTARIKTDPKLLVLMSASGNSGSKNDSGVYSFEMRSAIPSYLLAIAAGDLSFSSISDRCGIYAEPVSLSKSVNEFAELEKMVVAAEALFGHYRWGRYDLLVLPPSFPFGGMENPRLTFLTPSVIVGDRSLTSLVAHELAHSWSGNLVTNASWNDFWLNEGFTVYCERRIMEELYGKDFSDMLEVLGYQDLKSELSDLKEQPRDTWLYLNLEERNPDDGMNDIAYEKGYFLLKHIEAHVGRVQFDTFLYHYFDRFAFQSVTTEEFIETVFEKICKGDSNKLKELELQQWIYAPGLPGDFDEPASALLTKAEDNAKEFLNGSLDPAALKTFHPFQHIRFLQSLDTKMDSSGFDRLEKLYPYSQSQNPEILTVWLMSSLSVGYHKAFYPAKNLLMTTGRRKFLVPVYKALLSTEQGKIIAVSTYKEARNGYHSVAVSTLDKLLHP